jgi:trigger factor
MKIDLTEVSPVKRRMEIEVDAGEVARETDTVLRDYARKAKVPGFRPGKVPLSVIRARFAREVEEDVRERVVQRFYQEAAREKDLRPLGDPVLEEVEHVAGEPLRFKTTFEVLPEVEVKDYKGIEARRPAIAVGEAEVDEALENLRQSRVQLITEPEREAVTGDVIVADVDGKPAGGESFRREGMMLEVGATDSLPAFNEHLLGLKAGAELSFSIEYPPEYGAKELAGKPVEYELVVHEVKRREVPELDDEFAKDLGEFDDLVALKAQVRKDLEARKKGEADQTVRQTLLDRVLLANPIVLPDILVEQEIRHRLEELVRQMMMQGLDPEKTELDWKALRERQEAPARKSVHARLILDAIGRAESLEVGEDEIEERLRRDARAIGESPQKLRARLEKHSGVEVLRDQLVREKSLDLLTSVANIQNEE